ncbi:1-acyl-sn-glycerol-3-phosphate acyltransferase [Prauserella sediminis]|uniref:1-acyl-sn-glycerol-3-phosphate acyltransferase n=1 Tax=Prauserella sediminis TaxID=577680 RepID=A0A839XKG8_9PSEU|nr:lysophospholipid acyltransferase family protein [Prauserella sediminis]MBB3662309.1 1-acyl-sn-glycerol-3-phosphate acyltransferase [Prauserella sediminis]
MSSGSSAQVIRLHTGGAPGGDPAREADAGDADRDASVVELPTAPASESAADGADDPLGRLLTFLARRLTGDYAVDEFGFDPELTDTLILPPLKLLYDKWFRVAAVGGNNLPVDGGALLVGNHSGVLPIDSIMTALAVRERHPQRRHLRMLGADLVFKAPVLGTLARKTGQTLACNPDAERLLRAGELVGVWPEGFKGVGKPFSARYKLQRFGRGGFASAAMRAGVPIIPVAVVGAEEIYPKIGDIKPLARLLGLPYFPVTPFFPLLGPLGAVPLPTKWTIEFGEPIPTDGYGPEAVDDPMSVFNLNDQVRESIQQMLYRRLARRRNIFSG